MVKSCTRAVVVRKDLRRGARETHGVARTRRIVLKNQVLRGLGSADYGMARPSRSDPVGSLALREVEERTDGYRGAWDRSG